MAQTLLRPARIANKKVAHTQRENPEKRGGAENAEKRRVVSKPAKTSGSFRLGEFLRPPRLCVYSPPTARARGAGIAENLRQAFASSFSRIFPCAVAVQLVNRDDRAK